LSEVIRYSRGANKFDNTPAQREAENFDAFCDEMLADRAPKKGLQWIAGPCNVAPDDAKHRAAESMAAAIGKPHRCADCIAPRRFIGLDADEIAGTEAFHALKAVLHRYNGIVWTTHSHTPNAPRCRVVLELDVEADRAGMVAASRALRDRIDVLLEKADYARAVKWDDACDRPEQPLFLPPIDAEVDVLGGDPLCLGELLAEVAAKDSGKSPQVPQLPPGIVEGDAYAVGALASAARAVTNAHPGERNKVLNREAYGMGGFVGAGRLSLARVVDTFDAACTGWDNPAKTRGTIRGGIASGTALPRVDGLPTPPHPPEEGERELDLRVAAASEPPPRRELIEGFGLTLGEPALMAADGGVGKTLFSQQLATCIAGGVDWLGPVRFPGAVLAFYCEDPIDELHRRQRGICRQFGIDPASLHGWLHLRSRVGLDNGLMRFDSRDKKAIELPLLDHVEAEVARIKPRLLILDNLAQMFLGDLSDTSLATQFSNRMARIALQHECVVYMNAHTPKSGAEFYGAVAWNNAVRVRFFMESETEADPVNPDRRKPTGRTFLSRPKANYGDRTGAMILRWHDHALVRDDKPRTMAEHVAASDRASEVDEILLSGLAALTERRLNASHSRRAGNYMPKLLEQYDMAGGISRKEMGRGLDRLILNNRIAVDAKLWQRGNRTWVSGLQAREG